jgi:hypothetical protein
MKHPSQYTDTELSAILRAERLALTQRARLLKHEVRLKVSELEATERRLRDIEHTEGLLFEPPAPNTTVQILHRPSSRSW